MDNRWLLLKINSPSRIVASGSGQSWPELLVVSDLLTILPF